MNAQRIQELEGELAQAKANVHKLADARVAMLESQLIEVQGQLRVAKAQETRAKTYRASAERKAELIAAAARADICDMEEQLAVSAIQLAAALKEKADLIKQAKMDGMAMRAAD